MTGLVLGLFAETPLHPGAGQSVGAIDLPVSREATTQYPVIVGSSLKGALRDKAKEENMEEDEIDLLFGRPDRAGGLAVTDARLLLLPIRSLSGHFRWVTCPYILQRFQRDLALIGKQVSFGIPKPERGNAVLAKDPGNGLLFLEELSFNAQPDSDAIATIAEAIAPLIKPEVVAPRLTDRIVVLNDDDFTHFAAYGLPVTAHNKLDSATKTSTNLWFQEEIPSDTLFYALGLTRGGEEIQDNFKSIFAKRPFLQVGGDETVGRGWCAVAFVG